MQDLWYLRRLEGGLFTLQTVDYILAWLAMEDDGVSLQYCPRTPIINLVVPQIRAHLQQMLSRRDKSLKDIVKTLQIYHDNVDEDDSARSEGDASQKEILQHLIAFLDAC